MLTFELQRRMQQLGRNLPLHRTPYSGDVQLRRKDLPPSMRLEAPEPANLPGVDDAWSMTAWLRLGRVFKFLQKAYWLNAFPLAADPISESVLRTVGARSLSPEPSESDFLDIAISLDAFDTQELDQALAGLSWNDVLELRSIVLPRARELRRVLIKAARRASGSAPVSLEQCRSVVSAQRAELETAKEKYFEAKERLGLGATIKSGGTMVGLAAAWAGTSWLQILGGAVGASSGVLATASEVSAFLRARRKVRNHPLFFFGDINNLLEP